MERSWTWGTALRRHSLVAVGVLAFLYIALEPASWIFYEAYHATHVEAFYLIYSAMRGAAVFLPEFGFMTPFAVGVAATIFIISMFVSAIRRKG